MKKFLMMTAIILLFVSIAGYALWHVGTNIASEKIIEKVEATLDAEDVKQVNAYIASDPKLQAIVREVAATNPDTLPFQTKEQATRVLVKKVGINRLLEIQQQAQNGNLNKDALLSEIENTLTEDEISALKYVIYTELNK